MPDYVIAWIDDPVTLTSMIVSGIALVWLLWFLIFQTKLFRLVLKNLRRNLVRTGLTFVASLVLVFMITLIWTVVYFLDQVTKERAQDFKLIITERWQLPSQMPLTHAQYLDPENPNCIIKEYITPRDFMTWSFYGGTMDPTKFTRENIVFFFAMNPKHIRTMMDDLDNLDPELVRRLEDNRQGCLLGREKLEGMNKRVGDRFKLTSLNYKGIDLEFEIVGELPEGRYNQSGIMNAEYFNQAIDDYARKKGQKHPLDAKRLNLIWLRVQDRATFEKVGTIIENSEYFNERPIRVETASSGIASFLDAYRDLLSLMKWLVVPALLAIMALVNAIAISFSVRERRTEMAVMKVLGFRPIQVLNLILGESLLVGAISGFLSAGLTYVLIDWVIGGIKFPIAFFPAFLVPSGALFWGLAMGVVTSFLGAFPSAWNARNVKPSEVFAKVA